MCICQCSFVIVVFIIVMSYYIIIVILIIIIKVIMDNITVLPMLGFCSSLQLVSLSFSIESFSLMSRRVVFGRSLQRRPSWHIT